MKPNKVIPILLIVGVLMHIISMFVYPAPDLYKSLLEFWAAPYFNSSSIFLINLTLMDILHMASDVFICIGVFKIIQEQKIGLYPIFKFPIYLHTFITLAWIFALILNPRILSSQIEKPNWTFIAFQTFRIFLFILTIIHFYKNPNIVNPVNSKEASVFSRFLNYLIDTSIVMIHTSVTYRLNHPYSAIFISFNLLCYYFMMEFLFHQTIGKLHNNSFVYYKKDRFFSILKRTLSRFIPFDALSFFGKGWHDTISKTKVITQEKT